MGWRTLIDSLNKRVPDDEPLPILHILKSNGLADALWALKATSPDQCKMFAVGAARQLQHLRPYAKAIFDVAEAYVVGEPEAVSLDELSRRITLARYTAEASAKSVAERTADRAMLYALKTAIAVPSALSLVNSVAGVSMAGMAEGTLTLVNYAVALQSAAVYDSDAVFSKACTYVEERGELLRLAKRRAS